MVRRIVVVVTACIVMAATLAAAPACAVQARAGWHRLSSDQVRSALIARKQVHHLLTANARDPHTRLRQRKLTRSTSFDWYGLCSGFTAPRRITAAWSWRFRTPAPGAYPGNADIAIVQFATRPAARTVYRQLERLSHHCLSGRGRNPGTFARLVDARTSANTGCLVLANNVFGSKQRRPSDLLFTASSAYCLRGGAITTSYFQGFENHWPVDVTDFFAFRQAGEYALAWTG